MKIMKTRFFLFALAALTTMVLSGCSAGGIKLGI